MLLLLLLGVIGSVADTQDGKGRYTSLAEIPLPSQWEWEDGMAGDSGWQLLRGTHTDAEGFEYAFKWGGGFGRSKTAKTFVRRRVWRRTMRHLKPLASIVVLGGR